MSFKEIFSVFGIGIGGALAAVYLVRRKLNVPETSAYTNIRSVSLGIRG